MNKFIPAISIAILLIACKGSVTETSYIEQNATLESKLLGRAIEYRIYKPADTTLKPTIMLYLLHGHGGDHMDWFQKGEGQAGTILDSLIRSGTIPPLVAVSIDAGNSWYVDRPEPMRTFYLEELLPHIEETYLEQAPLTRLIAGNSAGGYGTLGLIMAEPELFDAAILLSPAAYYPLPPAISSSRKVEAFEVKGSFNDSVWKQLSYQANWPGNLSSDNSPFIHLSVGDDDAYNIVPVVSRLQQLLLEEGIENELRITDGGHDWECWRRNFTKALTDYYGQ